MRAYQRELLQKLRCNAGKASYSEPAGNVLQSDVWSKVHRTFVLRIQCAPFHMRHPGSNLGAFAYEANTQPGEPTRCSLDVWSAVNVCFACSVCAVSGYLASYWNRLFMPERCRDPSFDDSLIYNTMIRSAGSWTTLGTVFQMIMQSYSWRHLVVLSDQNQSVSRCAYGATSIMTALTTTSAVSLNYSVYFTAMDDNPSDSIVNYYLDIVHQRTRGKWTFRIINVPRFDYKTAWAPRRDCLRTCLHPEKYDIREL